MNPSLTPNEDALVAAQATSNDEIAARCSQPGVDGVEARITAAVVDAYNLAVAREMDRATPTHDVCMATLSASANLASRVIISNPSHASEVLNMIGMMTGAIVAGQATEIGHGVVETVQVARA